MAEFRPIWDEKTLRGVIKSYSNNPAGYPEKLKQTIQTHAEYYNVPFYEGEFQITEALVELGKGFAEGFTTLNLFEPADNEYEAIFRNLGHLGGFAPGIVAAPLTAAYKVTGAAGLLSAAKMARTLNDKSIPMRFANFATKKAKKIVSPILTKGRKAQTGAVNTVSNFMMGERAKHIAEGAFHLGAASGISAWQGGIDSMMSSFIHGGMAGGVFRGIGNFVNTGSEAGNKVARTLAGSLFMGLPSTMRGATTPDQVYNYVLGAWFGGKEKPWTVAKAGKFIQKFDKDAREHPDLKDILQKGGMDVTLHPEFEKLPEEVKPIVQEMASKTYNTPEFNRAQNWLFSQLQGLDLKDIPEGFGEFEKYTTKEGEVKVRIKEKSLAKFKNFLITAGGKGAESFISKITKRGGGANIHFVTKSQRRGMSQKETPGYHRELTKVELEEANEAMEEANQILRRKLGNIAPREMDLIRKNFYVVKNSDKVILVGRVMGENNRIIKATGSGVEWAHQMAVNAKKPTYIFDQNSGEWMQWKGGETNAFTPIDVPPKPGRATGVIGDFYLTQTTKNALSKYFTEHFKVPKKATKPIKIVEEEDKEIINVGDADTSSKVTNSRDMGTKAFNFVTKYMKDLFKGEDVAPIKAQKVAEHVEEITNLLPDYLNKGEKGNQADRFLVDMQKKYNFSLKGEALKEAENSTRQWFNRRNNEEYLDFIAIDRKTGRPFKLSPENPVTGAGERKTQKEPFKLVDMMWQTKYNKKGRAFAVVDHLTIETKDGIKDITLNRFRNGSKKQGMGADAYYEKISRMLKILENPKNGGYYYFGGNGTADRLMLMKFHPEMDKISDSFIRTNFKSDVNFKLKKSFMKKLAKDGGLTKKQASIYYDKAFKSNVLWHLTMNGMDITPDNIKNITKTRYFTKVGPKRHYISKETYNKLPESRQRYYTPEFHFISNAVNWNKRSQIWMTDSYPGDAEFYQEGNRGHIKDMSNEGNFKYRIVKDLSHEDSLRDHRNISLLSTQNPEHIDGAIIVRRDVLEALNADAGTFSGTTQNKSFIVSPHSTRGALLGKYMMHDAGKKQTAEMKEEGLHFIIQESAAKQRGSREFNTIYDDLNPEHIKFNYSVTQGKEMLNPQSIKKQVLGNLISHLALYKSDDVQKVTNDIFERLIQPRYEGDTKANKQLENYNNLSADTSDLEFKRKLDKLDFEKIGIEPLIDAMKKPGNQLLARKVYDLAFRARKDDINEEFEAGNIDQETYEDQLKEMEEFYSVQQRIIREGSKYADENNKSENAVSIYGHNFIKDYRMSVMSNWIIKKATQPKINNSGGARIRPYDLYLQNDIDSVNKRLKELDKNDSLFFLDEAYKDMFIETDLAGLGRIKLGELWDLYNTNKIRGKNKTEIKELFRSLVTRVPMDSMSGAQVLNFSGFTGRKGHGILMHSKAMKALGGADLDGDAAYFYMGGKTGFQKEWKDVYEANKEEFYIKENGKTVISPNKSEEYEKKLTKSYSDTEKKLINSSEAMFSPGTRMDISEAAIAGRALLGGAAVQPKQVMASVYNTLMEKGNDTFDIQTRNWNKKEKRYEKTTTRITISPRKEETAKDNIRKLGRAMVGFSSDPMDYAGLKSYDTWWRMLYGAHFKVDNISYKGPGQKKLRKLTGKEMKEHLTELPIWALKNAGVFGKIENANSAYYGRNYSKNRKWTMDEKRYMTSQLHTFRENELNTLTPKIARMLSDIDYSDNPLGRMDKAKVEDLYKGWNATVKELDALKRMLGRTSFKVNGHKYIEATMGIEEGAELYTSEGFRKVLKSPRLFRMVIAGTPYAKIREFQQAFNNKNRAVEIASKRSALIDIRDKAGDYIVKDLTDLNTMKMVKEIIDKMTPEERGKNDSIVEEISKSVDHLKMRSYLMARARARYLPKPSSAESQEIEELVQELQKRLKKNEKISFLEKGPKDPTTAYMDQFEVDKTINNLKRTRYTKKNQQDLFDTLLLGSLNRGDLKAIDALEARIGDKITKLEYLALSQLRADAARTSMSRLGFASKNVADSSIKKFLGNYSELFNDVSLSRSEAQINKEIETIVEDPQKQENIEKGLPENPLKDLEAFLTKTTGLEGVKEGEKLYKEGKYDAETVDYIQQVVEHLKLENNKVGKEFPKIVRALLHKDFNLMNKQDWQFMRNYFNDIRRGTLWQRLKKGEFTKLSKRHYMQFPETINRELMRDEILLMQEKGIFLTADGMVTGDVMRPTQYMDVLQRAISKTQDQAIAVGEEYTNDLSRDLLFVQELPDLNDLHELAIRFREMPLARKIREGRFVPNEKINAADAHEYIKKYKEALKRTDYENKIKNKEYTVTREGKRIKMTGEAIINEINNVYTNYFKKMHRIVTGNVPIDKNGDATSNIPESLKPYYFATYDTKGKSPIIDHVKFARDMAKRWQEGKGLSLDFGVDGLHLIARSMMIEMTKDPAKKKKFMATDPYQSGKIDFENYWPHLHFSKKEALASLKKYAEHIRSSDLSDKEMEEHLNKLTYRHHALTGDWNFNDIDEWREWDLAQQRMSDKMGDKENRISYFNPNIKPGSSFSRESHLPGWSIESSSAPSYGRSLLNSYFRQMGQILSRNAINDFSKKMYKKFGPEQTEAWTNFMKLWVQGASGNPDIIPQEILENKAMSIAKTPFAWFADNKVKDRMNSIADKLGLLKKDLPENLRGIDVHQLRYLSNLEAKYELASLLAHPKSVVNNIFGGQLHTIESVGYRTWSDSRNIKELQKINPEWDSKQKVDDFVTGHGVLPQFLISELGMRQEFQNVKGKQFLENLTQKISRDPEISQESILDIAKKSNLTRPLGELAAKFMSVPERALRRDAFMSHWLFWYKRFGNAIQDVNHPVLIELAKKGVQATQFLYNAPFRPMFARTALGKVMTRFQLWGWNAVRFRKDTLKQAKLYGFRGDEMERASRMLGMDLFVFALGNMFTYSLFEMGMPAPWNWLQDTSEWIFGDEKARNRAFFGQWPRAVAPLQAITPPILRLPMSSMRAVLEDDWSRVSGYYIYSSFPFGRIARDFLGPNNLMENPMAVVDKMTGLPLFQLGKVSKQIRGEDRNISLPGGGLY